MNLPSHPALAALHSALHEPPVFAWLGIDGKGSMVEGTLLFPRNWAQNGFARRPLGGGSAGSSDTATLALWKRELMEKCGAASAAIVLESPEGAGAAAKLLESLALYESLAAGRVLVLVRDNDRLLSDDVPLTKRGIVDATNAVRLEVKGARTQTYERTHFPRRIALRFGYRPAERALLHLHASAAATNRRQSSSSETHHPISSRATCLTTMRQWKEAPTKCSSLPLAACASCRVPGENRGISN